MKGRNFRKYWITRLLTLENLLDNFMAENSEKNVNSIPVKIMTKNDFVTNY